MLPPTLLEPLRAWWRTARTTTWLFPGQRPVIVLDRPMKVLGLSRGVLFEQIESSGAQAVPPHRVWAEQSGRATGRLVRGHPGAPAAP
jgi:hypothetical protein